MSNKFEDHFADIFQVYLRKGQIYRGDFVDYVTKWYSQRRRNVYIAGQPGVGKTYTVDDLARHYPSVYLLKFSGSSITPWALKRSMATAKKHCDDKGMNLLVYVDDLNKIFKANSELLDIFKDMMHKTAPRLCQNATVTSSLLNDCNDIERKAVEHYMDLDPISSGFEVDLTGVKFCFTMNTPLPSIQEVNKHPLNSDPYIKLNNRHAIRDRVKYVDLVMDKETYWGWIADVVWNNPNVCQGATPAQRAEMLTYMWEKWDIIPQHSVRYIDEDLWSDMDDYEDDYKKHWDSGLDVSKKV